MTAQTKNEAWEAVAAVYERSYGEPLVADWEWVGPLYETCEIAVACDPALEPAFDSTDEVVRRTARVIGVITHGK